MKVTFPIMSWILKDSYNNKKKLLFKKFKMILIFYLKKTFQIFLLQVVACVRQINIDLSFICFKLLEAFQKSYGSLHNK